MAVASGHLIAVRAGLGDEPGDARAHLRARARRLGVLATTPALAVDVATRQSAVEAMRGIGPVLDEILADCH